MNGIASLVEDDKVLRGVLARLTRRHEAKQIKPWRMSDAPIDYIQEQLNKIVAVQIKITNLVGKLKLSQNKSEIDQKAVADAFKEGGVSDLSTMMYQELNNK